MNKHKKIYYNIIDNETEEDIGPSTIIVDTVIEAVRHYHWAQEQGREITDMWSMQGHRIAREGKFVATFDFLDVVEDYTRWCTTEEGAKCLKSNSQQKLVHMNNWIRKHYPKVAQETYGDTE